jgi:hypothetical protein
MFRAGVSEAELHLNLTNTNNLYRPPRLPFTTPAPSLLPANTPRATIMADSMEGVVTAGEQPKSENVEQKAIAGM